MPELDLFTVTIICLAMVIGGAVKGMVGIGLPAVAIAIMSQFLAPTLTLPLLCLPILTTNLWQAVHAGRIMEPIQRFWPMILCLLITLWWSAWLVAEIDPDLLYGLIGTAMVIFTASSAFTPNLALSARAERWLGPIAGTLGGFLGGVSTIWGPPMVMYFIALQLPKEVFIRATGLIWFIASVPLVFGYLQNGLLDGTTAPLSTFAVLPAFAGLWLGRIVRRCIDQEVFRKILLFILFLLGLNLLRRAIF